MKKILLIILGLILVLCGNAKVTCTQGDQNPIDPPNPNPDPAAAATSSGVVSADPNELLGPTGFDSIHWVSVNDVLPYTIFFENDPEVAMAAAQKVNVSLEFPRKTLMTNFGLGPYSFANMSFPIEESPKMYSTRMDVRDSMQIYVDLSAGLDIQRREAFWRFSSIDPDNGYAPWQIDRGMLPVNDSTHIGEGFVTFRIKPGVDMVTGDTISLMANIVFDQNDTIPTNTWCVTVDAQAPTSRVKGTQSKENEFIYNLTFDAADDAGGCGVKQTYLYLANNMGVYEELLKCPVDSIISFPIEPGRQYKLYSIAEDNVGNREPLKEEPDLIINLNAAPTDIILSETTFRDDIDFGGFIGELSSVDTENDLVFTYSLTEGEGAIHNEMFSIKGTQLIANDCFKCAEDSVFSIRIMTTDEGQLSYSKAFSLNLEKVLEKPKPDTLNISICQGDIYNFHGYDYDKAGQYFYTKSNEFMCDSVYILNLSVSPRPMIPQVTIQNDDTLVSSAEKGNQWYKDGDAIEGATDMSFTPTETGIYYVVHSNGTCTSEPSDKFYANFDNNVEFTLPLAQGWNWISSNLATQSDPKKLLEPIEDEVERFVGFNDELVADPKYGLTGTLTKIEPTEAYKIQVSTSTELDLSGKVYLPTEIAQPIQKGWTWIGYVPVTELSLEDALSNLSPSENDVVKGQGSFSTFVQGKWKGTLATMKQGEGYMYYSADKKEFKYPFNHITKIIEEDNALRVNAFGISIWEVDKHQYPDNIAMIAQVVTDGITAPVGAYTIGAFVGDECRGVSQYVDDRLFITIHGQDSDDRISFKAYENATGNEYDVTESIIFDEDNVGTFTAPKLLTLKGATGINEITSEDYNIYPNPVRNTLYINGNIEDIKSLRVITTSGVIVDVDNDYSKEGGLNVSHLLEGHYILGIVTSKGIVYKRFLKVY